ncbi:hypothetical protein CGMCC3_g5865 [Colletotrichum fructicola]|nr:uncharacterized protein CGMCC3_g5865 [Colletotrichum fructicola]KAE9578237.1 hypothetical protein CGMCC3_g5865 [Colletotrichum fructicola]
MKPYTLVVFGLLLNAGAATQLHDQPLASVTNEGHLTARQTVDPAAGRVVVAAIEPTKSGQIGVNPPGAEPTYNKGHNSQYIAITTVTSVGSGGTAVATVTNAVTASKNAAGGLNILLSPGLKAKLEAIAKEVTACAAKHRRQPRNVVYKRQEGPACGLADYVQRVAADTELRNSFARPLTDQVLTEEYDSGYESGPGSEDGWVDGGEAEGGAESAVEETVIFSSEEEAEVLGAALSGGEAAANAAVWGSSTITAGSFLAWVWGHIQNGKAIPNANEIPKESIHRVTKTKTSTRSTSTSSSSCPTGTPPSCDGDCKPTSSKIEDPKATGLVDWACSEGKTKGCRCFPSIVTQVTISDIVFDQAVLDALKNIKEEPQQPPQPEISIECPGELTNVPSKFFLDSTSKTFCERVMNDIGAPQGPTPYDISGNEIPRLKAALATQQQTKRGFVRRTPPENIDNYQDYTIFLSFLPLDDECQVDDQDVCRSAWERLVKSNCGSNHGSAGDRMFRKASIDVGCGKFTWEVQKMAEKPSLGKRECHDWYKHSDVHNNVQELWSVLGCKDLAKDKKMRAGDEDVYWHPLPGYEPGNFRITWIDGCKAASEQSLEFPIADDKSITCASIMRENYLSCNNGGTGGQIDAGCLRYDFYPNK